jgi:hypothetical protein
MRQEMRRGMRRNPISLGVNFLIISVTPSIICKIMWGEINWNILHERNSTNICPTYRARGQHEFRGRK